MSRNLEILSTGECLHAKVTGKLTKDDYRVFAPVVDAQIRQHGKVRILFEMEHFEGWTAGALWEDVKFDFKHWHDIERLAIVGDAKWEEGMATFCKPFTTAKIKYFDDTRFDDAQTWLTQSA